MAEKKGKETKEKSIAVEEVSYDRFLIFTSGGLTIGVSTLNVVEIITNYGIRELPLVPSYIKGVINLRGQVLPVLDTRVFMKRKNGEEIKSEEFNNECEKNCIIILEIESVMIGIIVDSVSQVRDINVSKSTTIPSKKAGDLTNAMISLEDGSVILLMDCKALLAVS